MLDRPLNVLILPRAGFALDGSLTRKDDDMTEQALKFAEFKASREDVTPAEAEKRLEVAEAGFDGFPAVALFHANYYGFVTGPGKLLVPLYSDEIEADDDSGAWALYWDFYLPECHSPAEIGTEVLTDALREFCSRAQLPHMSADDLFVEISSVPPEDRTAEAHEHIEDLEWFIRTWEASQTAEYEAAVRKLTRDNAESHLETIWAALASHRENCIPEGTPGYDAEWDDICTAMAWVREDLGLSSEVESEAVA